VLGVVQGLAEFLPISSSGHLKITRWLFGWDELSGDLETAFDVAVHLGTLVGAIAYLWSDVVMYFRRGVLAPLRGESLDVQGRIAWYLVASAVPAGLVGLTLKDQLSRLDSIWVIAVMLIVFGVILWIADRFPERRNISQFTLRDALLMGVGQAVALQPGVSRSGATLTVSRGLGYDRDSAARLVFLMSIPVIAGAGLVSLVGTTIPSSFWPPFIWGMATAALTGYLAVWGTLKMVRTFTFKPFVVYRIGAGALVLAILATSWR